MSLVVHKLVLSPDGAAANTQTPTHHVTLAAYTHARSNVGDAMVRSPEGPPSGSMNAQPSSSLYSSSSSSSSKHSSTYNLPFVLQDHNYGAPPPPTPPQSPPPVPCSSGSSPYRHHSSPHHSPQAHPQPSLQPLPQQKHHHQHQHHHHHHSHSQQTIPVTSPSRMGHVTSTGSPVPVSGLLTSHPLSTMPPHRQQFMPHPKTSMFPSPHIPPPPVELLQSPTCVTAAPPTSSMGAETDDDSRLSDRSSSVGPSGEETETAPEGEGDEQPVDDSITRCVCDFAHDDGYMIQCDRCFVWQHVDCMEIDRDNIPDEYLCEACEPRVIDRFKARALQIRRRQEIKAHLARLSSSDSDDNMPMCNKSRASLGKVQERKVVKKKKVKQIKDMKNGRKGPLSLLKRSNTVSCNNNIVPGSEERDRRMLVKTRRRKSSSMSGGEGVSDDSCGGPVERLRAWVEGYEVAVTNHYSPELRARVQAARINGVSPDLRASTQGAVLGHRCKVVENPNPPLLDVFDSKILVAATRLTVNTAITEFQGKYLLASQWNAQQPVMGQQYLPFVLQYHMPKEGLTVCVDARTYGNDARFARRSCRPNAEIRHVVERGSLHLYLVATRDIEEAEEVTLALETANSTLDLTCCLPEEHECNASQIQKVEATSPVHTPPHKKNGLLNTKKTIKKQQIQSQLRTSKRTTSTESRSSDNLTTSICQNTTPVTPVKQRRVSGCGRSPAKSPSVSVSNSPEELGKDSLLTTPPALTPTPETPKVMDKQQQQKMTREERKIAAYMKAFERMEKAAQRRQEMEKKKEEDRGKDHKDKDKKHSEGDEEDLDKTSSADESMRNTPMAEKSRRKGKKGRGKGSPQKRNHRLDSTASDLTGDESSCASIGLMSPVGASIEGVALSFSSPPSGNSNAMGFRFPKTKKALMNEWLNETVDPVMPVGSPSGVPEVHSAGVPTCYMRSPATPLRRSTSVNQVVPGTLVNLDLSGGSAKKRWLRQAISEETESPHFNGMCPSPNSRPDSPTGGDYITPLKKRRLARESMSSEQSSTPPTTPVHSTSMEEDKMMEEMEAELAAGGVTKIKSEEESVPEDLASHGDGGGDIDTKDSICRVKREDNDGDELIIEEEEDKVSGLKDRGRSSNSYLSVSFKFEKEDRGEPLKEERDVDAPYNSMTKPEIPLCLSSPKTYNECDEREEDGEDEEEASVGRGDESEIKRKKKQVVMRRKKRQQPAMRRDRKQPPSTKKEKIQPKDIKKEEDEEKTVQKKEEDFREEELQGERKNTANMCSTASERTDERTPTILLKSEEIPVGNVKLEKAHDIKIKCEDENPEAEQEKTDHNFLTVNYEKKEIKNEENSENLNVCEEDLQVPVKINCDAEKTIICQKVVKGEKKEVQVQEKRKEEGSDERTALADSKNNENPNRCSMTEKTHDSKNVTEQILKVKSEISHEQEMKEEVKDQMEKGQISPKEVVKAEETVVNEVKAENKEENVQEDAHQCMVVKGGSTKVDVKPEQVLSSDWCIKQNTEVGAHSVSSVKVEEEENIPQTCSHDAIDAGCSSKLTLESSPSPEMKPSQRSPSPNDSPHSSSLLRQDKTFSESKNLSPRLRNETEEVPKEPKGPRTPEGPAPTSPEEPLNRPESPRTPEYTAGISPRRESTEQKEETTPERISRARVRGPCTPPSTPPTQQDDAVDAESERERDQHDDSDSSSKSKAAPVKRKLSILEYRKRKSVSSENETRAMNGPRDQSPPPPPSVSGASLAETSSIPSHPVTNISSNTMQESHSSPSTSSPSKANYTSAVDSSPDLSLSPIRPLSLSLPAVLDDKTAKDEAKRELETASQCGDSTTECSKDTSGSSKNTTNISATSVPGLNLNTTPTPSGTASQDVKWNAAPTLLERQRENLTARLRREFGLCISDDDEDKSGLRLGCVSLVGRPSPPLLPPSGSLISSSLSSRGRKPSGHQTGTDSEERDRSHRRHKEKNLPPPPPPPTAPPKNSIFQGREVTVQKVTCGTKGMAAVAGSNQGVNSTNTSSPSNSTGPLAGHTGSSSRLAGIPAPGPQPAAFLGSGVSTSVPVPPPAVGPIPTSPSGASLPAVPAPQASQLGLAPSPVPPLPTLPLPLTNTGVNPVDAPSRTSPTTEPTNHSGTQHPHLNSIPTPGQTGSHPPSQSSGYRARSYSRGQFSSSASGTMPVYPGRAPPPQPNPLVPPPQGQHGLPASVRPQGPSPAPGPAGLVSPGLSYNGSNYNGLDCSAPGSRGS